MATMTEVAKRAHVSLSVVSEVLSGTQRKIEIPEKTRKRVTDAVAALDYVPDGHARLLRMQTSPMIGVLVGSIFGNIRPTILNNLSSRFLDKGKDILLGVHHRDSDIAREHVKTFRTYRTGGVIDIGGAERLDADVFTALKTGRHECGPYVCINFWDPPPDIAAVCIDVRGMIAEFVRLMADRKYVVLVDGPSGRPQRWNAYLREAVKDRPNTRGETVTLRSYDAPDAVREIASLLRERSRQGPVGVLTANDLGSIVLMDRLSKDGVRIPEEIAFVGFGDMPRVAEAHDPSLTRFDVVGTIPQVVGKAVEIIETVPRGQTPAPQEQNILPDLVIRASFVPRSARAGKEVNG